MVLVSIACSLILATIASASSPLLKPCKQSDPNFEVCVRNNGMLPMISYLHGSKKDGVPDIEPIYFPEISIGQGTGQVGLTLKLTNIYIYGNRYVKVIKARPDLKKRRIEWEVYSPQGYQLTSDYTASGKILLLPITGNGRANINFTEADSIFTIYYNLIKKNGIDYMNVTKTQAIHKVGGGHFQIDNLFNGDKTLGENLNRIMNDNWQEMSKIFVPVASKAMEQLYYKIMKEKIFPQKSYDEWFPQ